MSIVDDILVAIDDNDQTKNDLEVLFPRVRTSILFSALGRLKTKKLVQESGKGSAKKYIITDKGADIIEETLIDLKEISDNSQFKWLLVSVSIPEKYKVEREKIRLLLKENGFGMLRSGLFIGQVRDIDKFKKYLNQIKTQAKLIFLPLQEIPDEIEKSPEAYWDVKKINLLYKDWIKKATQFINKLPSDNNQKRILSKSLVFQLAELIRCEPKILNKKIADSIGRTEAFKLYKKVREYCYL